MESYQIKNKNVYIVILNWNQKENTLETLDSLQKLTFKDFIIIVVDNNSTDGSQEAITYNYSKVILIENKENLGYAEGNNIGIKYALKSNADYIFILNNDVILDAGSLSVLIERMEKDKNIGIAGPKTYFYSKKNIVQSMGGILDKNINPLHIGRDEIDRGQFENNKEVDFVTGSAMLISREVFDKIGIFDPKYFMYWEETDLCYRAKKEGFKLIIVPQAKIWHKGGINSTPLITYYMTRNKLLFLQKHKYGYLNILNTNLNNLKTILSWTLNPKFKDKNKECKVLFKAICDYYSGKTGKVNI